MTVSRQRENCHFAIPPLKCIFILLVTGWSINSLYRKKKLAIKDKN